MTAADLAQEIRALPTAERAALIALFREEEEAELAADAPAATAGDVAPEDVDIGEWSAFDGSVPVFTLDPDAPAPVLRKPLPDFAARLAADFPNGVPGKPLSEIVIESRGPY